MTFAHVPGATVTKTIPTHLDARTYWQFRQRLIFWAGIDYWHSLTPEQQAVLHTQGRPFHLTGYQYSMRQYLRTLPDIALWLRLDEAAGTTAHDKSNYASHGTIHGATHIQTPLYYGLDFISDDYVEVPAAATHLNFTSQDFSIITRLSVDYVYTTRYLIERGIYNSDGWLLYISTSHMLAFFTNQTAAAQVSYATPWSITPGQWYTHGLTRQGASARVYLEGVDRTHVAGTHIDPLPVDRSLKLGIHDNAISHPLDGQIDIMLVFLRALSATEHAQWHQRLASFTYPH